MIPHLRSLLAAATPGPWRVDPNDVSIHAGDMKVADVRGWGWLQKKPNGAAEMDANGELIAAAVSALPALIEVAERAKQAAHELDAVADFAGSLTDHPDCHDAQKVYDDATLAAYSLRAALAKLEAP